MGFFTRTPEVEPGVAAQRREQDEAIVVDVREDDEWQAGHIPGAVHIPLGELPERVDEVPHGRQVIVACRSGARSAKATDYLRKQGRDAVNLAGGTKAWHANGLPLDPPDGRVA